MKKRILSILLTLCMVLCIMPTDAFAEGEAATGAAAVQLGTAALNKNVNTATAPTVYFGQDHENNPGAWRVIGYDGNGAASARGDMTLLAAGTMGVVEFDDTGASTKYAPSNLRTAIDALAGKLTAKETDAVQTRTLTSGSYNEENTDCVAGGQVDNAVFWPLSAKEAIAVNNDLRALEPAHPNWVTSSWWLRSPGSETYYVAIVSSDGSVQYSGVTIRKYNNHRTVRPAFNLNLNSVLFASAAVGGKPDGGLTAVSAYSGNEWKLTLLDSSRNFAVTETTASGDPGDTVTLHYTGATAGINEYISVIIADNNGAQYYGRVAQPTEATGTVEIKIPSDIAPGSYTLKAFSEQCNGEKKADYASDFVDIDLTVGYQEQFTLTRGDTYYFDLSGENIPGTVNGKLPDSTLRYVPFTYAGTVNAYSLKSEADKDTTSYEHSLFIANYNVTHTVSWDALNTAGLLFGKDYAGGGVNYTLRAPSAGLHYSYDQNVGGTPRNNEWDVILDKAKQGNNDNTNGYVKNWQDIYSWGQDKSSASSPSGRSLRGYRSSRHWYTESATRADATLGFRPVLEVLNPGTLGSEGLKVVTLDLGGGKLGGSSDAIQIIVKNSSTFTAPASDGLTRPDGNTGRYFMWLGSDGKLYAPGASVPADVTALTVQWTAPTYAVTLHANGGSVSPASVTTGADGKLASLPTPTRNSYSFNGWYTEKNGGTKVTTDTVFSANTTVYAHWTYTGGGYYYPPVTYYTLRFETGGGSDISSVQGTYNAYIDLTQYVPTWRGHTFTGWYSERSLTNKVSGVYLTKDMTVYAGWRVTTAPQTDDSSVLGLWGISLCTSLAGCLALTTWQIRRRREEQSLQSIEK